MNSDDFHYALDLYIRTLSPNWKLHQFQNKRSDIPLLPTIVALTLLDLRTNTKLQVSVYLKKDKFTCTAENLEVVKKHLATIDAGRNLLPINIHTPENLKYIQAIPAPGPFGNLFLQGAEIMLNPFVPPDAPEEDLDEEEDEELAEEEEEPEYGGYDEAL